MAVGSPLARAVILHQLSFFDRQDEPSDVYSGVGEVVTTPSQLNDALVPFLCRAMQVRWLVAIAQREPFAGMNWTPSLHDFPRIIACFSRFSTSERQPVDPSEQDDDTLRSGF